MFLQTRCSFVCQIRKKSDISLASDTIMSTPLVLSLDLLSNRFRHRIYRHENECTNKVYITNCHVLDVIYSLMPWIILLHFHL